MCEYVLRECVLCVLFFVCFSHSLSSLTLLFLLLSTFCCCYCCPMTLVLLLTSRGGSRRRDRLALRHWLHARHFYRPCRPQCGSLRVSTIPRARSFGWPYEIMHIHKYTHAQTAVYLNSFVIFLFENPKHDWESALAMDRLIYCLLPLRDISTLAHTYVEIIKHYFTFSTGCLS